MILQEGPKHEIPQVSRLVEIMQDQPVALITQEAHQPIEKYLTHTLAFRGKTFAQQTQGGVRHVVLVLQRLDGWTFRRRILAYPLVDADQKVLLAYIFFSSYSFGFVWLICVPDIVRDHEVNKTMGKS